ncbi:MAG TPA: exodeoxyribonuclease VII small subunit [Acidimicrobiales bacterium]
MSDPTPGGPDSGTDAGAPGATDTIRYADALAELEAILDELDGDEVDVDVLGARVRRAAELLRLCRDRISAARFEVEQVVAELEAETATPLAGASDSPDHGDGESDGEGDGDGDQGE